MSPAEDGQMDSHSSGTQGRRSSIVTLRHATLLWSVTAVAAGGCEAASESSGLVGGVMTLTWRVMATRTCWGTEQWCESLTHFKVVTGCVKHYFLSRVKRLISTMTISTMFDFTTHIVDRMRYYPTLEWYWRLFLLVDAQLTVDLLWPFHDLWCVTLLNLIKNTTVLLFHLKCTAWFNENASPKNPQSRLSSV